MRTPYRREHGPGRRGGYLRPVVVLKFYPAMDSEQVGDALLDGTGAAAHDR
jgi:hypothetical protein